MEKEQSSYCKWCDRGDLPAQMLDEDGCLSEISGQPGRMRHAYSDYVWLCRNYTYKGNLRKPKQEKKDT